MIRTNSYNVNGTKPSSVLKQMRMIKCLQNCHEILTLVAQKIHTWPLRFVLENVLSFSCHVLASQETSHSIVLDSIDGSSDVLFLLFFTVSSSLSSIGESVSVQLTSQHEQNGYVFYLTTSSFLIVTLYQM